MSNTANTLSNHVSELLARRISDGNWPVGQQIPPEVELSLIYKCSRTTIRRALNKLEKAGMISRRPKIGTVVISKGPGVSFSYSLSNFDDINQLGQSHRRQILEVAPFVADRLFASTFSVSEGSEKRPANRLHLCLCSIDLPWGRRKSEARTYAFNGVATRRAHGEGFAGSRATYLCRANARRNR